jgi:hypothetical protein
MHEWLVTGAQASVRPNLGSWDAHGQYVARPPGATEADASLDLYAGVRTPWKRLQVAAFVPLVLAARSVPGTSAVGGGLGDMNFSARLDVWDAERKPWIPGVAVLAGITVPTGTAPESASRPLAVDATGTGSVRGIAGFAFEKPFGAWLFDVIALTTLSGPRSVGMISTTRAPGLALTGAATYVFEGGDALGASITYQVEWDALVDGMSVKDSSRRVLRLGAYGLHPFGRGAWRLLGSLTLEPPISELGQNELSGVTLLLGLQRGF